MSANNSNKKRLVAAFVQFVRQEIASGQRSEEETEALEVSGFGMEDNDLSFQPSRPLMDSFSSAEGLSQGRASDTEAARPEPTEADKQQAEALKNAGNELMRGGSYEEAVQKYTDAIKIYNNAVYYCNRAAAYGKLDQHDLSIQDCRKAVAIDPAYSKAYGRMGLALSCQNRYGEAVDAYKKALEFEPDNENYKNNMEIAQQRASEQRAQPQGASPFAAAGGANPFGGVPGGLDLGSILNNPAMMNMATQMLSDPNMQNMMSNMMGGMMNQQGAAGGGGNQQGLSGLLQVGQQLASQMQNANPDLVDQLRRSFQGGEGSGGDPNNPNNPQGGGGSGGSGSGGGGSGSGGSGGNPPPGSV